MTLAGKLTGVQGKVGAQGYKAKLVEGFGGPFQS